MKAARLICSCLLILTLVYTTQAAGKMGGTWWWYYYQYWSSSQPGSAGSVSEEPNLPPSISGNPESTATEGQLYTFTPSASDPEGDTLTFNVRNLPDWASFDKLTGTLSGTPNSVNTGLYEDIIISVSDAAATTSLDPISIMVNPAVVATGTVELSWTIPVTRTDNSPLAPGEVDGFRIYMGETRDNLSMIVDLNDGAANRYSVTDLASGAYYFAVTAYDVNGNESAFSKIADKLIL